MKATRGMTEVLLGQGYYQRFDPKLESAGQPYPPLGALIAAACLRETGYSVSLFDSMLASSPREWDRALASVRPRVAVVYEDSFNYLSKMCLARMREATFAMLQAARARGCLDARVRFRRDRPRCGVPGSRSHRGRPGRGRSDAVRGRVRDRWWRRGRPACRRGPLAAGPRRRRRPHAAAPLPQGPGRAATAGMGPGRLGPLSPRLAVTPRVPLDEPGHDTRLPVPLQLVREADLRTALRGSQPRGRGRGDGLAEAHVRARPPLVRGRHLRPAAGLGGAVRTRGRGAGRAPSVQVPHAGGPAERGHGGCPAPCRLPHGLDRRRVGLAADPRRDGEGQRRRAHPRGPRPRLHAAGIEVGFFLQFGYPGETREDIEATLPPGRASAARTTSGSPCRTRCPARASTSA